MNREVHVRFCGSLGVKFPRATRQLPLTFQIGAFMNLVDLTSMNPDMHSIQLHVDAQRPRDFAEHIRFGLEYTLMDIVSLRGGFQQVRVTEEQGFSAGAGLKYGIGNLRFGAVNRISLQIGL